MCINVIFTRVAWSEGSIEIFRGVDGAAEIAEGVETGA